jgi:hypothetical protein
MLIVYAVNVMCLWCIIAVVQHAVQAHQTLLTQQLSVLSAAVNGV